jgi:formiminotetrahydrofolate cyclodeaminase
MKTLFLHRAEELETVFAPDGTVPPGSAGALAGSFAASILSTACGDALSERKNDRTADELRGIQAKALSLRRDLLALVEHGARAAQEVAAAQGASGVAGRPQAERLRALLFASEVPLRIAESCLVLLNLSLRALGRIGLKAIAEIGTAAALAFSGVVGGIVTARTYLAGVPQGAGIGAAATRKRAERIFREAESIRTQIIDRVRQHLP